MNTFKISIAYVAVALVFASCRTTSTGPNGGGGTPLSAAHPGSTFRFTLTETDQNGNPVNTLHTTDSIVAIGINWQGKSNVIEGYGWDDQGNRDTGYYSLLDDGDVAFYLGPIAPGVVTQWEIWPFGSGGPVSTTIEDQTTSSGGFTFRTTEVATYTSGADTTITLQGATLTLKHVIGTYVITQYANGVAAQTSTLPPFHYYWSPALGFAAGSQFSNVDAFGGTVNGIQVLTGFTLR
jgi:hypothetical protein